MPKPVDALPEIGVAKRQMDFDTSRDEHHGPPPSRRYDPSHRFRIDIAIEAHAAAANQPIRDVDLFLFENSPDFGCEVVKQYPHRVIVHIGGIVRQHLAGKDGDGLAIMSGFSFRARINNLAPGKHA